MRAGPGINCRFRERWLVARSIQRGGPRRQYSFTFDVKLEIRLVSLRSGWILISSKIHVYPKDFPRTPAAEKTTLNIMMRILRHNPILVLEFANASAQRATPAIISWNNTVLLTNLPAKREPPSSPSFGMRTGALPKVHNMSREFCHKLVSTLAVALGQFLVCIRKRAQINLLGPAHDVQQENTREVGTLDDFLKVAPLECSLETTKMRDARGNWRGKDCAKLWKEEGLGWSSRNSERRRLICNTFLNKQSEIRQIMVF
jgi:hypothetical protein